MLSIYFGNMEEAIYDPSMYFRKLQMIYRGELKH